MPITEADLQGLPEKKLRFIVENGDPSGQLVPLAKSILASRAPQGPEATTGELSRAEASRESRMAQENYEQSGMREPPITISSAPSPYAPPQPPIPLFEGAAARGVKKQLAGMAAAAAQTVPGVSSLVEGVAGRPVLEETVQESPSPIASRGTAMLGSYLATRGAMGGGVQSVANTLAKPVTAPYSRILAGAQKVMPRSNVLPHVAAGAGSAGLVAGGEAALRRGVQAVSGNDVESLGAGELAVPILAGSGLSLLPGIAAWARDRRTPGGLTASEFEDATRLGMYEKPEMRRMTSGDPGIEQAKELGKQKAAYAKEAGTRDVEQESVNLERDFAREHGAARDRWMGSTDPQTKVHTQGEYGKQLDALMANDQRVDPTDALAAIDDIVAEKTSQSAMVSEGQRMSLGGSIANLRERLAKYLGPGATLRDYKNAIDEATALAEQSRSSDVASNAYKRVEAALRADAEAKFEGFAELSARHREFQTGQERAASLLRGKAENQLGEGDPLEASAENRIRGNFRRLGKGGPAAEADAADLEAAAPYTKPMVERARGAQAKADAALAEAEGEGESIVRAKKAQEASRFRLKPMIWPATAAAIAAVHPNPWTVGHALIAGGVGATQLSQPIRSSLAAHLPPTAALESTIPRLIMPFSEEARAARQRIDSQSLVDAARRQGQRVKQDINALKLPALP